MLVMHTAIQNDGYSLSTLEYRKLKKLLLRDERMIVYPLKIKKRNTPRNPYLNISPKNGKYKIDILSAAYPLKV